MKKTENIDVKAVLEVTIKDLVDIDTFKKEFNSNCKDVLLEVFDNIKSEICINSTDIKVLEVKEIGKEASIEDHVKEMIFNYMKEYNETLNSISKNCGFNQNILYRFFNNKGSITLTTISKIERYINERKKKNV